MKRWFVSVVDSLHYLFSGELEEEPAFKTKLKIVLVWTAVIVFCLLMLKLLLP